MKMKLNKPAMLAALSCLALAGYAGAASLSQITPKSVDVVFTYAAIPLKLEMTKIRDTMQPGTLAANAELARVKLQTTTGVNARLGLRWAPTPAQAIQTTNEGRLVEISGAYNPVNKLKVRFWFTDAQSVSINGGEKYWTTNGAGNIVDTTIQAQDGASQTVNADRYVMTLEGAVYRP